MSLLDHLWDDTVAGPPPETGLGKLRKYHTFSFRQNSGSKESVNVTTDDGIKVSRSIMIMKPQGTNQTGSPPISPASSTPPISPFSGASEAFRFKRRSISDIYEKSNGIRPGSPRPPHDLCGLSIMSSNSMMRLFKSLVSSKSL